MKIISVALNNFVNDSRILKECISLKSAGHEVQVVALHAESLAEEEVVMGIGVTRIKLQTKSLSSNLIMQVVKYVEFVVKLIYIVYRVKPNIIHCNDLEPLPATVLAKIFSWGKTKIVYDCHELESEKDGQSKLTRLLASLVERLLIKFCDWVITVSDGIADFYKIKYGIKKPSLVLNCPNYREIVKHDIFRNKWGIGKDKKIFLYQGHLSTGRGLELLLESFQMRKKSDAILVVMGYGPLEGYVKEFSSKSNNIFFHDAVFQSELLNYTSSADVGCCLIENSCMNHDYCLPNKFFEYVMAGIPILCSNVYELKNLIQRYNCGWVIEKDTIEVVQKTIELIMSQDCSPHDAQLNSLGSLYCWENQEKILIEGYELLKKEVC